MNLDREIARAIYDPLEDENRRGDPVITPT